MVKSKHSGFIKRPLILIFGVVAAVVVFKTSTSSVAAASSVIKSGVTGFCLDDYQNGAKAGNKVVLWICNNSPAQSWAVNGDHLTHQKSCLSVQADRKDPGAPVVADSCAAVPGQIWLKDNQAYYNPNSAMCLTAQGSKHQLVVMPCGLGPARDQAWSADSFKSDAQPQGCKGSEGQVVACYAEREWVNWQSGAISHTALLNKYTDNTSYEQWCADFVSYVYKEAGYPLKGAYDGWDENNANNIQNYNFTMHPASSGYVPKTGDVAYFDYNGGHVEIVVSGGKTPTFVYGDAAAIDPTTGNGQMKANTIVNDGPEGRLVYYLSPN